MKKAILPFVAGVAVVAGGVAIWKTTSGDWREVTERHWPFGPTIKTIGVGEVVDDIRPLNRLVVFRAYITATTTTHEIGWLTQSDQTILTPAYVNYYVDMDTVRPEMIDVSENKVKLKMPRLMIERPNIDAAQIQVFNKGLFSILSSTTDRLRMKNNIMASRQLFQRADMPFLVDAANTAARAAVSANVRVALAANGHRDLNIEIVR